MYNNRIETLYKNYFIYNLQKFRGRIKTLQNIN